MTTTESENIQLENELFPTPEASEASDRFNQQLVTENIALPRKLKQGQFENLEALKQYTGFGDLRRAFQDESGQQTFV